MSELKSTKYSFSRDFQETIVALMYRDPKFLERYSDVVNPAFFSRDDLTCISRLILKHYHSYNEPPKHIDQIVLDYAQRLSSSVEDAKQTAQPLLLLIDKLSYMDLSDVDYVTETVIKFGRFQSLMAGLQQAMQVALADDSSTGEGYEDIQGIIQKALAIGKGSEADIIGSDLLDDIFEINAQAVTARVPTNFKILDQYLNGGLGVGEIGAFVAASGVGKSIILTNIMVNAALLGYPVLYVSAELDQKAVLSRSAACLTGMDATALEEGSELTRHEYFQRLSGIRARYGNPPYKIQFYPPKTASVGTIRSLMTHLRVKQNFVPKLLVVDYADELKAGNSLYKNDSGNTYLEMGSVFKELRSLGKDFECPVWTASQTNREGVKVARSGNDVCDMYSLADSYMKVMVSDCIITVNQSMEEKNMNIARFFTAKMRRGPGGRIIRNVMNYPIMRVYESERQPEDQ